VTFAERADRFQRRHPRAGFPLAVMYKFFDDPGPHLAALLAYYGFVSLFPMLLLLVSTLGFVLHGDPDLQRRIVDSALANFPIIGPELEHNVKTFSGSTLAIVVGMTLALYGGLGIMQAAQAAFNRIYAVPRSDQPNPIKSRLRGLMLLVFLGLGALMTTVLAVITVRSPTPMLPLLTSVSGLAVNIGLFFVAFRVLTAHRLAWRDIAPGAVLAALLWHLLQLFGTLYLRDKLQRSTEVYGVFGLVLGLLAWLYVEAVVVVIAAELNVVRQRHLYPRSLLTPFTDDADLTEGDQRAYALYVGSERYKGFEKVSASFERGVRKDDPSGEA
jgi:membrane protein